MKQRGTKKIEELIDYSSVNVFEEADVYPIVFRIINSQIQTSVRTKVMLDLINAKNVVCINKERFFSDIYWDKYFFPKKIVETVMKISNFKKIFQYNFQVVGAATVNEAYNIKKYLKEIDNETEKHRKLINTGTIDPFKSLWGIKTTKYIKGSYLEPVISDNKLKIISKTRLKQAHSSKIIIAGMSLSIEAFFDNGNYLAGKSTVIVLGENTKLKALTAVLNSKLISFWFSMNYNSLTMAGGYFNIGTNEINSIPVPENAFTDYRKSLYFFTEANQYLNTVESTDVSLFINISNALVVELYFEKEIHESNLNILQFVEQDLKEVLGEDDFEQLSDEQKEKVIEELHKRWSNPDSEIVKRMNSFAEKSPDILKPILDSK